MNTRDPSYTQRLMLEQVWWKRLFHVQAPYRFNLKRLKPGFCLEIGCGIGRNLGHLDGDGIGVDHNSSSVEVARARGFLAFTPEEVTVSTWNHLESFDSLLFSHVLEHMTLEEAVGLVNKYLPFLRRNGKLIFITPQEAGFKNESTHVEFMDFERIKDLADQLKLKILHAYSFPFPRVFGKFFHHNEFVVVAARDEPSRN